jgi:hypothetical protein
LVLFSIISIVPFSICTRYLILCSSLLYSCWLSVVLYIVIDPVDRCDFLLVPLVFLYRTYIIMLNFLRTFCSWRDWNLGKICSRVKRSSSMRYWVKPHPKNGSMKL